MRKYVGMTQGKSYAYVDLPSKDAEVILKNIVSLGWDIVGTHPLMNSPDVPPVGEGSVRVWGINWPDS